MLFVGANLFARAVPPATPRPDKSGPTKPDVLFVFPGVTPYPGERAIANERLALYIPYI